MTERQRLFILNGSQMRLSPDLAAEIGLMESIVLLQLEFLVSITTFFKNDKPWIRYTMRDLTEKHFSWSSVPTVWRAVQELEKKKLIVLGNFNNARFDKTTWITLNLKGLQKLNSVRVFQHETAPSFQSETPQVSGVESPPCKTESFQSETPVSNRDTDARKMKHRDAQNETTIGKDLRVTDLPTPVGTQSVADEVEDLSQTETENQTGSDVRTPDVLRSVLRSGQRYPRRYTGHLAREIKGLLDQDYDAKTVTEAARRCVTKGLNPSCLASLLVEVQNGPVKAARGASTFKPSDYIEEAG